MVQDMQRIYKEEKRRLHVQTEASQTKHDQEIRDMHRSHEQKAHCLKPKIQKFEETHNQERNRLAAETQAIESKLRQETQKEQAKLQKHVMRLESQIHRLQTDFDIVNENRQHQKDLQVEAEAQLAQLKSKLDAANTTRVAMENIYAVKLVKRSHQ